MLGQEVPLSHMMLAPHCFVVAATRLTPLAVLMPGFSYHPLYDITTLGFQKENHDTIIQGMPMAHMLIRCAVNITTSVSHV